MRMKKIISCLLVLVLLASAVPLAVAPAAAYEKKLLGDADENEELIKEELANDAILPYMLGEGALTLDDVGDAAYIYAYWNGKPRTVIDMADREVTFYRPVERVVLVGMLNSLRTLVHLGAADKIVATSTVAESIYDEPARSKYFSPLHRAAPELKELPRISYKDPSLEFILTLKPDVILSYGTYSDSDTIQEATGIPTACIGKSAGGDLSFEQHRIIGKIVGREEEAEELISYVNEKHDELREVTSQINDSEKPKVYVAHLGGGAPKDITTAMVRYDPVEIAGGINVAKECAGVSSVEVSKEQIIAWNPDIILMGSYPSKPHKYPKENVISDPDLQTVNAVKNQSVYYTKGCMIGWDPATVTTEAFYFAKLFHPDKFKDLDVEETCNEILEKFYGVDGLYTEMTEKCDLYKWD